MFRGLREREVAQKNSEFPSGLDGVCIVSSVGGDGGYRVRPGDFPFCPACLPALVGGGRALHHGLDIDVGGKHRHTQQGTHRGRGSGDVPAGVSKKNCVRGDDRHSPVFFRGDDLLRVRDPAGREDADVAGNGDIHVSTLRFARCRRRPDVSILSGGVVFPALAEFAERRRSPMTVILFISLVIFFILNVPIAIAIGASTFTALFFASSIPRYCLHRRNRKISRKSSPNLAKYLFSVTFI